MPFTGPPRGSFWCLVSDLHWGKAETFQRHGIPVPGSILNPELGSLVQWDAEKLQDWTREGRLKFTLILGNHDRKLDHLPRSWPIEAMTGPLLQGPFAFVHEPEEVPLDHYGFSGHLHPTVVVRGGHDRLRLPCFHVGRNFTVLPAFSHFTRGLIQSKAPGERIFAVAGPTVIEV